MLWEKLQRFWRRGSQELWQRPEGGFAALDGLRALAAGLIMAYHSALFAGWLTPEALSQAPLGLGQWFLKGAWVGIDIFFVLSGFLLGRILWREYLEQGRLEFRRFWIRRAVRIFPAYYLVLILTYVWLCEREGFRFFVMAEPELLRERSWSNFLYLSNYFYPGHSPNLLSWGWSLCVEEQFYWLLPPVLWWLFRGHSPRRRWAGLTLLVLLPSGARLWQFWEAPQLILLEGFYYYSHNHFDELLIGVMTAALSLEAKIPLEAFVKRHPWALTGAGLTAWGIVWNWGGLEKTTAFTVLGQWPLMALGSALLVLQSVSRDNAFTRFWAHRAWYPWARVSYGMYLVHPFLLFELLPWFHAHWSGDPLPSGAMMLTLLACVWVGSWLVAALMFLGWEAPWLRWGHSLPPPASSPSRASRPSQG